MAVLSNGLETIELGATAWRVIHNQNIDKLYTKDEVDDKLDDKANLNGNKDEKFKVKDAEDSDDAINKKQFYAPADDMTYTNENIGTVLIDRNNTDDKYRLYIESGELKVEKI